MLLECLGGPPGDAFESGVECLVLVFLAVVAVVHELAELGGGGPVTAEFCQFFGVHPDAAFGAVWCVSDFDFSVQILCAQVGVGVLRLAWVSGGLNASYFFEGVRYVRPRERAKSRGAHQKGRVLAIADEGVSTQCHTGVSGVVLWVSQREMRSGRVS